MRFWSAGFMGFVLIGLVGVATGQEQPTTQPSVELLLQQLGSEQWQERETARQALIEIGPDVAPRLREMLEQTSDPEVRAALETVLSETWLRSITSQTRVTMDLQDVTPEAALTELLRQAGGELNMIAQQEQTLRQGSVSFKAEGVAFWEAFRDLARRIGVTPREQREGGGLHLMIGTPDVMFGPTAFSGPFMLVLTTAERRASINLHRDTRSDLLQMQMRVFVEPKLRIYGRSSSPVVTEAVDEDGQSLAFRGDAGAAATASAGGSQIFSMMMRLKPPPTINGKMVRLRGHFVVATQTRSERLEVDNLAEVEELSKTVGPHQVLVRPASTKANERGIRVTVFPGAPQQRYWDYALDGQAAVFYDIQGNELEMTRSTRRSAGQVDITFTPKKSNANDIPAPPVRLVWDMPVEMHEMNVPFEFRDVPLP